MRKSPDELSRELSQQAKMHPHSFFSFLLIDASAMIRELANLPALADPLPEAFKVSEPKPVGRRKLLRKAEDRPKGFFLG